MKTFDVKIEKTLKLTEGDIGDILSACFFGGCGYWACLDNSDKEWDIAREALRSNGNKDFTVEDIMAWILCNGRRIYIEDIEDDNQTHFFDLKHFFDGINMAVIEGIWDGEDICDIDGAVGDAIIQFTVFGEIVYG